MIAKGVFLLGFVLFAIVMACTACAPERASDPRPALPKWARISMNDCEAIGFIVTYQHYNPGNGTWITIVHCEKEISR